MSGSAPGASPKKSYWFSSNSNLHTLK